MFNEDLSVFFDDFGVSTTLAGTPVRGIFEAPHELGHVGQMGMASVQPTFRLPSASVPPHVVDWFSFFTEPRVPVDLRMTINRKTYQIVAHEPDGTGVSVLVLELVE
jgi:hypothetical protein